MSLNQFDFLYYIEIHFLILVDYYRVMCWSDLTCHSKISLIYYIYWYCSNYSCFLTCRYYHKLKYTIFKCFKLQSKQCTGQYNQTKSKFGDGSTYNKFVAIIKGLSFSHFSIDKFLSQLNFDTIKQVLAQSIKRACTFL